MSNQQVLRKASGLSFTSVRRYSSPILLYGVPHSGHTFLFSGRSTYFLVNGFPSRASSRVFLFCLDFDGLVSNVSQIRSSSGSSSAGRDSTISQRTSVSLIRKRSCPSNSPERFSLEVPNSFFFR